jgi:N utilization substance protein A
VKSDFLIALTQLAAERHLPREQVLQAIEVALASAFKKDNPASGQNISVRLNPNTGEVGVYALRTVVEAVEDPEREISLVDALGIKKNAALGDEVAAAEPLPHNASRIAAQTAKQVVLQRLREAERDLIFQEFLQHEGDIVSGVIEQGEPGRSITLDLGRAQAILPYDEQVPTERYRKGQRTKVYLVSVRNTPKGPEMIVSRSHKNMLKRLFEIEVPEVYNGIVEIKAIAREAGFRSKVAVTTTQRGIDPVGSCIGIRGNRIQSIVNELQGEKIDVVSWDKDPKVFIAKALSPSEVVNVELSPADQSATVVVPDRQLSLAIGREGQNTRLAARLTGWRLDIKGLTEWGEIREARLRHAKAGPELETKPEIEVEVGVRAEQELITAEAAGAKTGAVATVQTADATGTAERLQAAPPAAPDVESAFMEPAPAAPGGVAEEFDEDAILEALIQEEEKTAGQPTVGAVAGATPGFSVDDLKAFTLDEVGFVDEEDDEPEESLRVLPELTVLTPDAGKIRFAEDIVDEARGGARGARKTRRGSGSGARGGVRRGGRF